MVAAVTENSFCESDKCEAFAGFRFRWPGRDWQNACIVCANGTCALANQMGFTLQVEQLPEQPWQAEIRQANEARCKPKLIVD